MIKSVVLIKQKDVASDCRHDTMLILMCQYYKLRRNTPLLFDFSPNTVKIIFFHNITSTCTPVLHDDMVALEIK